MNFQKIKNTALIALFSDDDLMEEFVLKGGTALSFYDTELPRSSIDIDVSMEHDLASIDGYQEKIERNFERAFREIDLAVIDLKITKKPNRIDEDLRSFWGGYKIEFKLLQMDIYNQYADNIDELRKRAEAVGKDGGRKFPIDISPFEYCGDKEEKELDGYTIYVYSPEMFVFEKLRAICQQMPEYKEIIRSNSPSARARDFYDIHFIAEKFGVKITDANRNTLEHIFAAKKVPLTFLQKIPESREMHRGAEALLKATIKDGDSYKGFDFYFDYVVDRFC